ncbi:MAG TPA: phospho-sugar mutase, partial [Myxococcota bacterium]|nr:phospho-sugar mutase [Myxococcota bacterium]
WLTDPQLADWRPQIEAMFEQKRWDLLLDCFYQVLPFGTGGRRGPVGVGPNRFNPWTLSASVQGHVEWLKSKYGADQPLSVVIAYDVRRYLDSVNLYDRSLPNPAMGLSSRDFAEIAAGVYVANGVAVTMLPPGSDTFVSTPELSFAIRHLRASGGLNISASHNPPDDNGGKFYNALGGQEVPPDDERMATLVEQVQEVRSVTYAEGRRLGRIHDYGPDIHDAYVAANLSTSLKPHARSASVVFTGLHGTGDTTVAEVLRAAGFRLSIEPTQASHDGSFPNVPFRTPNPEVRASMERAVALAKEQGADLVMACDPDADRIGLCCRDGDDFRFFTGNEIGVLVTEYRLLYGNCPRPIVLKTEVTSDLIRRVAERHGARVVGNLMVGFKYIGEALRLLEFEGSFLGIQGELADFCVGIEESHGVLVTPLIRDKDAAGAALALAEYASILKEEGKTLADALRGLWLREGYLHNDLVSTVMRGAAGRARIEKIQQGMRDNPPTEIGGHAVTAFYDRADPKGPWGPIKSGTDAASRDMLVFQLGPDRRILLRPSGTEPKNKIYVEVCGRP